VTHALRNTAMAKAVQFSFGNSAGVKVFPSKGRLFQSLGDELWAPLASLQHMLDDIPLVPLSEALSILCSIDRDVNPTLVQDMCNDALFRAGRSPLLSLFPKNLDLGLAAHLDLVAALIIYTFHEPVHIFSLICDPLNKSGVRKLENVKKVLPYLKLLTVAQRSVPHSSDYFFDGKFSKSPLYRGVSIDKNPRLKENYVNYKEAYANGKKITFTAPTSTTITTATAAQFTQGIQFVIHDAHGIRLKSDDLSVFDEDEVLLEAPVVGSVEACAYTPGGTLVVILRVMPHQPMAYLSRSISTSHLHNFFDKTFGRPDMNVFKQSPKTGKMREIRCCLFFDPKNYHSYLKYRTHNEAAFAQCEPKAKRYFTKVFIMGPRTCMSVHLNLAPICKWWIKIHLEGGHNGIDTSVVSDLYPPKNESKVVTLAFQDEKVFENFKLCANMCFNRAFRIYVDRELNWDPVIPYDSLFVKKYSYDIRLFLSSYICLLNKPLTVKSQEILLHDPFRICKEIVSDIKAQGSFEISDQSQPKMTVTISGPNVCWHIDRLMYEKKCDAASLIQQQFMTHFRLKKLQLLRDVELMPDKPRRVKSYFQPFLGTHYLDSDTELHVQSLLSMLARRHKQERMEVEFCATMNIVSSSSSEGQSFQWLENLIVVLCHEKMIILGRVPNQEKLKMKISQYSALQGIQPQLFVHQIIETRFIDEAILSRVADDALVNSLVTTTCICIKFVYVFRVGFPAIHIVSSVSGIEGQKRVIF
jgi:hypothetical protein